MINLFQYFLEISSDTQQALLELVCFYNNKDDIYEDWIEERWYTQANKDREEFRNTWKYVRYYFNICLYFLTINCILN